MTARNPNSGASSIPPETLQKLLIFLASFSVAAVVVAAVGWKTLFKGKGKAKAAAGSEVADDDDDEDESSPMLKVQLDSPKYKKEGGKSFKKSISSMFRSLSFDQLTRRRREREEEYSGIKHVRLSELATSPTDRVEEGGLGLVRSGFEASGSGSVASGFEASASASGSAGPSGFEASGSGSGSAGPSGSGSRGSCSAGPSGPGSRGSCSAGPSGSGSSEEMKPLLLSVDSDEQEE